VDATGVLAYARVRRGLATLYCSAAVLAFVLTVGAATQLIPFGREFALVWGARRPAAMSTSLVERPARAEFFGARDRELASSPTRTHTVDKPFLGNLEETTP
jgi:alpha-D-ribose 1-methylphosphonate 5-triphosphate synthase subunit PhnI